MSHIIFTFLMAVWVWYSIFIFFMLDVNHYKVNGFNMTYIMFVTRFLPFFYTKYLDNAAIPYAVAMIGFLFLSRSSMKNERYLKGSDKVLAIQNIAKF